MRVVPGLLVDEIAHQVAVEETAEALHRALIGRAQRGIALPPDIGQPARVVQRDRQEITAGGVDDAVHLPRRDRQRRGPLEGFLHQTQQVARVAGAGRDQAIDKLVTRRRVRAEQAGRIRDLQTAVEQPAVGIQAIGEVGPVGIVVPEMHRGRIVTGGPARSRNMSQGGAA